VEIDGREVEVLVRELRAAAPVGTRTMRALVTHFAALLETSVKQHASGRPGPNVITGDYRRSITRQVTATRGGAEAEVGTNAVQGPRLEYGFHGTDSLGRHYDQPPYPHFRPAADEIEPQFVEAVEQAIARVF
jgi:hypothetical protein